MSTHDDGSDLFSRPGRKSSPPPQPTLGYRAPPTPGPTPATADTVWDGVARLDIPAPDQRTTIQQRIADLVSEVGILEEIAEQARSSGRYAPAVAARAKIADLREQLARLINIELLKGVEDELDRLRIQRDRAEAEGSATAATQYQRMILEEQRRRDDERRRREAEELLNRPDDLVLQDVLDDLQGLSDAELEAIVRYASQRLGYDLVEREAGVVLDGEVEDLDEEDEA